MRSLIMLWALILSLGLTSISHAEPATEGPTSAPAVAARKKLDASVAKADREQLDFVAAAREAYLSSLKQALDAAMNAASLEDAKWAKAEIERIKAGEPASPEKPKLAAAAAAQARFLRAGEKAQEDRKRSLDAARKQYITELEAAKRTALSVAKDLDEAGRIAAEIERAKVMAFREWAAGSEGERNGAPDKADVNDKAGQINLLKLIDLDRDRYCFGEYRWEKDGLLIDGGDFYKSIRLPYQPPAEYDFAMDLTVVELRAFGDVIMIAGTGDRSFGWNTAHDRNRTCSFWAVNGRPVSVAGGDRVYTNGQRVVLRVKVRANGVTGWINDRQVSSVDRDSGLLFMENYHAVGLHTLGFGTFNKVKIHAAEVMEISGPGRVIRHLDAHEMKAQAQVFRGLRIGRSVSLTEIKPRATQVGASAFLVNQVPLPYPVILDGKPCGRYLYTHAPSSVLYDIPAGAIGFRAVSIRPSGAFRADLGQWRVAVTVDDCEVLLSGGIQEAGGQIPVEVPLSKGARQIELRTDPMGRNDWDQSIWANPEFLFPQ